MKHNEPTDVRKGLIESEAVTVKDFIIECGMRDESQQCIITDREKLRKLFYMSFRFDWSQSSSHHALNDFTVHMIQYSERSLVSNLFLRGQVVR